MKIIIKIEELANKLLIKLGSLFVLLIDKITPDSVKKSINKSREKIQSQKKNLKDKALSSKDEILKKSQEVVAQAKALDIKGKVDKTKEKVIAETKDLNPQKLKVLGQKVLQKSATAANKIGTFVKPKTFAFYFASITTITGLGIVGYNQFNNFLFEAGFRQPASVPELPTNVRPSYYKLEDRILYLNWIILPIIIEDTKSMKSVKMEVYLECSNRQTKLWLFERQQAVGDYLHTNIEPVVPSFPLNPEGREIIRGTILREINKLLERSKSAEGKVDKVHIKDILGG